MFLSRAGVFGYARVVSLCRTLCVYIAALLLCSPFNAHAGDRDTIGPYKYYGYSAVLYEDEDATASGSSHSVIHNSPPVGKNCLLSMTYQQGL